MHELRSDPLPCKSWIIPNAMDVSRILGGVSRQSTVAPIIVRLKAQRSSQTQMEWHFGVTSPDVFAKVRLQSVHGDPSHNALLGRDCTSTRTRVQQECLKQGRQTATS